MDRKDMKTRMVFAPGRPRPQYRDMEASMLFCPKCNKAVPVRKNLLLVLPEGEKYDYVCAICSSPVGSKIEKEDQTRF